MNGKWQLNGKETGLLLCLLSLVMSSCGVGQGTQFGGKSASRTTKKNTPVIMDVSGSLAQSNDCGFGSRPDCQKFVASDPLCYRWKAFSQFVKDLRTSLGPNSDSRLNVVTFSDSVMFQVSGYESFLSSSDSQLESQLKDRICYSDGGTKPSAAFDRVGEYYRAAKQQNGAFEKQQKAVLFFSDGSPTYVISRETGLPHPNFPPMPVIRNSIAGLQSVFPSQIYSIYLDGGYTLKPDCVSSDPNCPLQGMDFIRLVSPTENRVAKVSKPEELDAVFKSIVPKK
jgi:hypothetical protein